MRRLSVLLVAGALLFGACGDGDGSGDRTATGDGENSERGEGGGGGHDHAGNPTSACSPSGTSLAITASGTAFDANCLAAPAGQPFTLVFDNKDAGTNHNIAILRSHSDMGQPLFRSPLVQGPKTETFDVGALSAGTYAFHCEVHPARMSGSFVVK